MMRRAKGDQQGAYECCGITRQGRMCLASATVHLVTKDSQCVKHYCRKHARGEGVMRMLLPMPWDYDHVEVYS